jgi:hypothetical protein
MIKCVLKSVALAYLLHLLINHVILIYVILYKIYNRGNCRNLCTPTVYNPIDVVRCYDTTAGAHFATREVVLGTYMIWTPSL